MIDIGELKLGDRVRDNVTNNTWFVSNIEYLRSVDDEHEEITVALEKNPSVYEQFCPPTNVFEIIKERKSMKNFKTNKYRVIVNDPAVILFVTDGIHTAQKYVSKAHNEPFDVEKGLLMCLAKANGISHLDLKRMIKSAKVQKKQEKQEAKEEPIKWATDLENKVETHQEENINSKRFENEGTVDFVSPHGKHRGKPYTYEIADCVVVRDCYDYKYQNREDVVPLLNQEQVIEDVFEDGYTITYVIEMGDKRLVFAGSELEPIWEE